LCSAIDDKEGGNLSPTEIAETLSPFVRKPLSGEQLTRISNYLALLKKWNETIPLTSIEDSIEIVARHFGESIFAGSLLDLERGRLADVGSGAGFPGLPLKIAFPELEVILVEPNIKKCAFLREVQSTLGLSGVDVLRSRYEDFAAVPNSLDFICSRALGGYKRLLQWSKSALKSEGHVILWLGVEDSNLLSRTKGWNWNLPVNIPESRRRVVLSGRPRSLAT
jgi:16S rRNA (guanine527-N7)-methyltransferase